MRPGWLVALLVGACGEPNALSEPRLEFTSQIVAGIPTIATAATPHKGGMKVTGTIRTPTTSYVLSGTVRALGSHSLELEITAADSGGGLPFFVQNYYQADVRALGPGAYVLSVIHSVTTPPAHREEVYHQIVLVPAP